jgi:hypothetical protein
MGITPYKWYQECSPSTPLHIGLYNSPWRGVVIEIAYETCVVTLNYVDGVKDPSTWTRVGGRGSFIKDERET